MSLEPCEPWKRIGPTLFLCRNTPDLYDKPIPFLYLCPQKKTTDMELFNKMIAAALKVSVHQVDNTLSLLGGGATIPFISRYRKEATGGLDEVQIGEIKDRNDKLCELAKRKEMKHE